MAALSDPAPPLSNTPPAPRAARVRAAHAGPHNPRGGAHVSCAYGACTRAAHSTPAQPPPKRQPVLLRVTLAGDPRQASAVVR
jgi:hypothetical protein